MLGNAQSIQPPCRSTPAPLCSSPTKGFHPCVYCNHNTARVSLEKWKQHHPAGKPVYGLSPDEHPKAKSDNLDWWLFCWICDACFQMWYSYRYYKAVEEAPLCSNDFNPLPPSLFKDLPATPSNDGEVSFGNDGSTYSGLSLPTRSSSLSHDAWSTSQSTASTFEHASLDTMPYTDPTLLMEFDMVPMPAASVEASADLNHNYQVASFLSPPQAKHTSAPPFSNQMLAQLDDATSKRWSEPVDLDHTSLIPDVLHPDGAKAHKRGEKFDHPNYVHMRRFGACQDCRTKRRKCHPSHPRM